MQDLRSFLGWQKDYYDVCREERNVAAIFYQLLSHGTNLENFLRLIKYDYTLNETDSFSIYFEYAYLRDLWHEIGGKSIAANEKKKEFILNSLNLSAEMDSKLRELSVSKCKDFNSYFITNVSEKDIQSPGNWNLSTYDCKFKDPHDFEKICWFKWAFNAKPDIVIHLPEERAICIEGKLESGEGSYPSSQTEQTVFNKRLKSVYAGKKIFRVKQTSVQSFLMTQLLGKNTKFVILSKKNPDTGKKKRAHYPEWQSVFGLLEDSGANVPVWRSWDEVFNKVKADNTPRYMEEIIKRSSTDCDSRSV